MGYWLYYLAFAVAWYVVEHPLMLVPIVLVLAFRRFIPDPWVIARTFAHSRRLREQIAANPTNQRARRDLAMIYLERLRPKKALAVLAPAVARDPEQAELRYLEGLALFRTGRAADALEPLVLAAASDPRVRFGDAYRVAGDVLMKLKRYDDAVDAFERFTEMNTSSIEGWFKLSRAHEAAGESKEAKQAAEEAKRTWGMLPAYKRRQQWRWRLRSFFL